jgi:hypothetical protein
MSSNLIEFMTVGQVMRNEYGIYDIAWERELRVDSQIDQRKKEASVRGDPVEKKHTTWLEKVVITGKSFKYITLL